MQLFSLLGLLTWPKCKERPLSVCEGYKHAELAKPTQHGGSKKFLRLYRGQLSFVCYQESFLVLLFFFTTSKDRNNNRKTCGFHENHFTRWRHHLLVKDKLYIHTYYDGKWVSAANYFQLCAVSKWIFLIVHFVLLSFNLVRNGPKVKMQSKLRQIQSKCSQDSVKNAVNSRSAYGLKSFQSCF